MRTKEYALCDDAGRVIIKTYHSVLKPQKREQLDHHHTECEISVFLSGAGKYAVKGKEYDFKAGDVFLFGSNEAHCITEITEDMDLLNVQFEAKLLWERTESVELLNLFAARNKNFSNRFCTDEKLQQGLARLEHELRAQDACVTVTAKYLLFSLLVHIIRHYDCIDPSKGLNSHSSITSSLKKAIHYINENIGAKLSLEDIAAVACMSPTYFSSVFKKFNGVSPWEYITIKRVERAIELLRTTELTKLEIAEQCGFTSSSNFYKAFFHVTGKKPSDFVK